MNDKWVPKDIRLRVDRVEFSTTGAKLPYKRYRHIGVSEPEQPFYSSDTMCVFPVLLTHKKDSIET